MAGAIRFELVDFEYGSGPARGIDPVLGGTSLRELVSRFETRLGRQPAGGYGPLLLTAPDTVGRYLGDAASRRTALLGCVCGDEGCWPLEAAVTFAAGTVSWADFTQPHRPDWTYDGLGPFVFARPAYEAAVHDVARELARS